MIQDIFPHVYHNEMKWKIPDQEDFVLCYGKEHILYCKAADDRIDLPRVADLPALREQLQYLFSIDERAYYLAESGQEDANITRLLDRYAGESSHFSWQQRDPVLYPTFAQQYDGASVGSVVLVCGDNSDVLSYNDMYEMDLESYYTTGTANYSF